MKHSRDFLNRSAPIAQRWRVLYDADCGFCNWLLSGLLRWDREECLHPMALRQPEADGLLDDLAHAERTASWHLVSPDGDRYSGGAAVPPLLRLLPRGRVPAAMFARVPKVTDRGYKWVAEHRSQLSGWVPMSAKRRAAERIRRRELALYVRPRSDAKADTRSRR